jgi:hypothetical protein
VTHRLVALDQYRGLTVLAMFAVNFLGKFEVVPDVFKHKHTFCSFADVVMPQFLFAVGIGMRLSYLRRREQGGHWSAVRGLARRNIALILLGIIFYHLTGRYDRWEQLTGRPFGDILLAAVKRGPFETLTHIGVTALWVLPVIGAPGWVRVVFAVASGSLHVWVSLSGYYAWNLREPLGIDGGPLGLLTWTIPLIAGTLVADRFDRRGADILAVGGLLLITGYYLSLINRFTPPNNLTLGDTWRNFHDGFPFVGQLRAYQPNYWTMSLRSASVSYLVFATGFALVLFVAVRAVSARVRWAYLDLLGRHALAGYIVHDWVSTTVRPFVPANAPWWYVALAFAVYLGVTTLVLRHLDREKLVLRL